MNDTQQDRAVQVMIDALAGCARGEGTSLARLYRSTSGHLYAQLLRITRNEAAAEDCLQQVYLRVWHSAGQYDPSRARPMTWLSTLTRNIGIDWLRRKRPDSDGNDELIDSLMGERRPEQDLDAEQQAGDLHRCLAELPGQHRQAMELAYFQGLTHSELAEVVAEPLGTVKSWIRRGLERLKSCLTRTA
ncbi:sigma-70 family RNA polymerase sigma factor [Halomonas sp. V046]|uniref:sigma-70 family RNA polymerase sigma factor n=1 Tax=Halomonas sp. V046 TaxID=3459611 RepID=UPI004044D4BC